MKPEVTALPGFEELDFSQIKKPDVKINTRHFNPNPIT